MRRLLGGSVLVVLVVMVAAVAVAQLPPGGTFVDEDGNFHESNIEAIAAAGITQGCNPPANDRYCPGEPVTRAEMAAFLLRGIGEAGNLPIYQGYFSDVPSGLWYTGYTERLHQLAITTGCAVDPLRYCPSGTVTRAEMAAFLLRATGEDQNLPAYQGYFSDVPAGLWYAGHVERLFELGITTGCATGKYCPNDPVKRDQMASFIARTLGLTPIFPPPPTTSTSTSTTTTSTSTTTTPVGGGGLAENWFLVIHGASEFACHDDPYDLRFDQYECWFYYGTTPIGLLSPDLYCSGSTYFPRCDPRWYPNELDDYTLLSYGAQSYICKDAFSSYASYGDLDCTRYSGGAPPLYSFWSDLMCSPNWGAYDCSQSYYPSEMNGRFFATIGWSTYVCEDTWQGSQCWGPYYSGHPSAVVIGFPDYYCDFHSCDPYGYP